MANQSKILRILCLLSLLSMILCGCAAKGDIITVSGFYKSNETRGIEIEELQHTFLIDYAYKGTECVLPSEFTEGQPINWVSEGGMSGDENMQSLVIPDCYEGVCLYSLSSFPNLKTIQIGSGLSWIESYVFSECPNVESVAISSNNPYFYSTGNCIIERGTDALRIGFACSEIPEGVKKISNCAFAFVNTVQTIHLPASLTEIEWHAFSRSSIETITIPSSVVLLDDTAFNECAQLRSVYIPSSVTQMGERVFQFCSDVTIYCEADSQPESWDENWLEGCENPTVIWGYTGEGSE